MADLKISQLAGATTPLAGTEVLPIVQSSSTKKVAVSDLTAGRAVSASSITTTGTSFFGTGSAVSARIAGGAGSMDIRPDGATDADALYQSRGTGSVYLVAPSTGSVYVNINGVNVNTFDATGNMTVGVAAKGVNFTANTPAAGMTSQLLNWYEEGTWTPTVAASSGTITSYTVTAATYTRIGRVVVLNFDYTITNNGTGANGTIITGLPFNIANVSCIGTAREVAVGGIAGTVGPQSATQLYVCSYNNGYLGGTNWRIIGSLSYNA